jgi:hypothetical protein
MSKTPISNSYISEKDQNTSPKKTKTQQKNDTTANKNISYYSKKSEEEKELYQSKYCYKTPYNSKYEDLDYSKMEMPVSYQLTNGKCIRLRNSQQSKSFIDTENEKLNLYERPKGIYNNNCDMSINLNIESKSDNEEINHDKSIITIYNRKLIEDESKSRNSLISDGKKNYIYPMKFLKHHKKKLGKELSQASKRESKSERKTYKKFDLMVNPSYKYNKKFISSPIHKYLPYCKKDDEVYKKNLIRYIRTEAPNLLGGAKSIGGIYAKYVKNSENKNKDAENDFYLLKKQKKIYSTKKIFAVEKNLYNYSLIDGKNRVDYSHPRKFNFYFDRDIGFNQSWQSPLIIANGDDDVETDDEVLGMAEEKCMDDLVEGINTWHKSSRLCRNFVVANRLNKIVKTPTFIKVEKNKICGVNGNGIHHNMLEGKKKIEEQTDFNVSFGKFLN